MTETSTTTTTTTTTATQVGTSLSVQTQSNTVQVGSYVTDVSLNPYVAPEIISFYGFNLRPNQTMHAFFNSINVDEYCAPGVIPSLANTGTGNSKVTIDTSTYTTVQATGTWGDPLETDSDGTIAGQFCVPASTFTTGTLTFELADVTSISLGNDSITTSGFAQFTASNLNVTKQALTLTTVNPVISTTQVTNTVIASNTVVTTNTVNDGNTVLKVVGQLWEPIAQGLTINTPTSESGVFAVSLTLFFEQKSQISNNGVKVYICETNNGYPDGSTVLPFSTVHLKYQDIAVSNDATVGTTFTFEAPVFLNDSTEYAFVVQPDNNDPDYDVWSANVGDIDVSTGLQVYSQPAVGTAFYGATTGEWTALQTEYIKFTLNVANFTQSNGTATFNNSNTDYLEISSVGYVNSTAMVLPGDTVYVASNSTPNTVNSSSYGILSGYDTLDSLFVVNRSTGTFSSNSFVQVHRFANATANTPNSATLVAYANVTGLYDPLTDAVMPCFAEISPPGTSLSIGYLGTSNSYVVDTVSNPVSIGSDTELYDRERIVASRSNEVSQMSGAKSANVTLSLFSDSYLLSPLIDTVRSNLFTIGNLIDPVGFYYSDYYSSGTSRSVYVSEAITLAPGQDSEDLQVTLTAHRPPNTDVKVFARFLNSQDQDSLDNKTWTPLYNTGYSYYSSPSNPSDYGEYTYVTYPYYPLSTTSGTISSANTSNTVTGNGTSFGTDVKVGWWVNMLANSSFSETSRLVTAIANSTSLSLNQPFNGNYSNSILFAAAPPTTAWNSNSMNTQLPDPSGGNTALASANTTSNIVVGTNTVFTALLPGSIISLGGDEQVIVSIANNTQLTVGTPWSADVTAVTPYVVTPSGLSYLNSNGALFTDYISYQLKVILQADDSSRVPLVHNLSALSLQL